MYLSVTTQSTNVTQIHVLPANNDTFYFIKDKYPKT